MDGGLENREKTLACGFDFAKRLQLGDVVALYGDLGAGKTTFVQGVLKGLGIQEMASSPTFTYVHSYDEAIPIHHFDLYRLASERDFIALGFEEMLYSQAITLIEWPERIEKLLRPQWRIRLRHAGVHRMVEIDAC